MMWTGISVVIKFDKGKKKSGYELFFFVVYVKLIIVFSGNFFILSSSLERHAKKQHALETRKQENNFFRDHSNHQTAALLEKCIISLIHDGVLKVFLADRGGEVRSDAKKNLKEFKD